MRRMQIQPHSTKRDDLDDILPLDPRDPDVVRVKHAKRPATRVTRRRSR